MDPELAASLDDLHVLLVDESEERQAALRSFPPLNRCPVICAANGFYVTRAVNVDAVDIIVINDAPADVAGETTLRVIRQQPELVGIPIIVLTNEGGEVIRRAIDRESEVHFIFKPFTAEMLVNRMRHLGMGGETLMEEAAIEELYQSRQHKPSVLVVDADPAFLEWVETALSYHNIECCCANSSLRALDLLQSFSPEVIFWDEDLSREELLERKTKVKIETGKSNVPIYAMSGLPTREGVEFSDNTLAGRLQKPFPISDMMDIIAQTGNR
jgi:DNA-binding response OmpR family regulator